MSIVPVVADEPAKLPQDLTQREKSLLLASKGCDLAVIREANAADRPSGLLAPTMKIHRKKPQELFGCDFHPDGQTVMAGGSDGILEIYHVYGDCHSVANIRVGKSGIRSCGYVPDGSMAYACLEDGTFSLWNLSAGTIVRRYGHSEPEGRYHEAPILDGKISKSGDLFLSVDNRGTGFVWDLRTHKSVQRVNVGRTGRATAMLCADWGRDDKLAYIGTDRGSVMMYDLRKGPGDGPIEQFGRESDINAAFENETTTMLGMDLTRKVQADGSMGLANSLKRKKNRPIAPEVNIVGNGRVHGTIHLNGTPRVTGLSVNPHGDLISVFSSDNKVRVYRTDYVCEKDRLVCELPSGPIHNFENHNLRVNWSRDGKHLAVGSADRKVYVYKNMDRLHLSTHSYGPYGQLVDQKLKELMTQSAQPTIAHVLDGHISGVTALAWHPRDSILGTVGTDGQIILGELELDN